MTRNDLIGSTLAVTGSTLSLVGALANNLFLAHALAMQLWMMSNPILAGWAIGQRKGVWNGGLSMDALIVMYLIFTVTNFYGLFLYV
jgi:hypothetical protein